MKEERVFWQNGLFMGEGLLFKNEGEGGAVICHPHPQMGGSMFNNVVETACAVFQEAGYSTLRFNFRGVGESGGSYDEGEGEKQDILSACQFMKSQGIKKIFLVGYSFGAWICCRLLQKQPSLADEVILISPPQKYFVFDWTGLENVINLIICGDSDLFADATDLRTQALRIFAKWVLLPATDHFYFGREEQLAQCLNRYIYEKKA